ncbi:MAG: glycoside hydrolase family 9 protein [Ignavibacteriaceae bacterium]
MQYSYKRHNGLKAKRFHLSKELINNFGKLSSAVTLIIFFFLLADNSFGQKLRINDQGYFETPGVNIFVFNNQYNGMFFDEKTAGIEIIHHGVRTATGGAIRLSNTPEQWDQVPSLVDRKVDEKTNSIDIVLRYNEYDFNSKINVTAKDNGVLISVYLDKPIPEKLVGDAGFNLEFLPSAYFGRTYIMDGNPGNFPKYPSGNTKMEPVSEKIPQFAGHTTFNDRGKGNFIVPEPLATGKTISLAPEDPERFVKIESHDAELMLFDGRNLAQNGWFVVRSLLPANKTGKVLEWYLEPNAVPNWIRKPNIGFSQVGYMPNQEKVSVIELDKNDTPLKTASLFKVTQDGKYVEELTDVLKPWGKYLRYNYVKFDFSSVKEPGLYYIKYGDQKTNTFPIDSNVYANVWHPTLDVWFPVQMDHMEVKEAYRVWHGVSYLDDALQAPVNEQHFDNYKMGPTTQTKYKPLERIPGLAVGGWYDAGDFDIQTGSHNSVISSFVDAWEEFGVKRDETFIDEKTRHVDIHRPDGEPDILQQIEHGTLNLVAQVKNIGYPVRGIVSPKLYQYNHLGDASTITDNLPYNPKLKPYESDGKSSGTMDDRWVFSGRNTFLDYGSVAALAAASRALKNFNKSLSDESLAMALKLWNEDQKTKEQPDTSRFARFFRNADLPAALELYITTKEKKYADIFLEKVWASLEPPAGRRNSNQRFFAGRTLLPALKAIPYMDAGYKAKLKDYVIKYKQTIEEMKKNNPYGVPISGGGWGGSGGVVGFAITNYYAYKVFPDIMSKEDVLRSMDYIFGCHPYSNESFVEAVGTRSKKLAYGNNRADFSIIAGGIVPGVMLLKPDFLENKDDWPFLWGENEVTIGGSASYIFLANAVNDIVHK